MQRSFSIVADDDENHADSDEKDLVKKYSGVLSERKQLTSSDLERNVPKLLTTNDSDSDDNDDLPIALRDNKHLGRMPSAAGPSGRQTVLRSRPISKPPMSTSESDNSDGEPNKQTTQLDHIIPGEYDPKMYEHLDANAEMKEIFQYITKYIPQAISLDHKFKPFIPEFLPAVGDIDAFLKVIPPATLPSGDAFDYDQQLGLTVLDEPAANQSDSALLHLQLRAESLNSAPDTTYIVKKVDNVEKNAKVIDKWIKDISALHKSKSSPSVRYTEAMPDLDELMQEWPEEIENKLKDSQFPQPGNATLEEYVETIGQLFQIPTKNKIHSMHLFFSLYAAVNSSQLFKNSQISNSKNNESNSSTMDVNEIVADQLVLE